MKRKAVLSILAVLLCIQIYQYHLVRDAVFNYFIGTQKVRADLAAHHIEEYLEGLERELILISRLDEVKAMDKAAEGLVWKIVTNDIEKDWFTELYITDKDFDGFHVPFMVFEFEGNKPDITKDEYHALERESEEYALISGWRDTFRIHKAKLMVSGEINLCVDYRGFVASVPVYKDENFTGQVSAMFSKKQLFKAMDSVRYPKSDIFIIDAGGNFITREPSAAYSKSPGGPFDFNADFDKAVVGFKENASFKDIEGAIKSGKDGYGFFNGAVNGKMNRMFIYYLPIEWGKSRLTLGITTPASEISGMAGISEKMRAYYAGCALNVLLVLVMAGFIVGNDVKREG